MNKANLLDFFKTERWKKIEVLFKVAGMAVILTVVQLTVLYIVFKISIFEIYRAFFDKYLLFFHWMYLFGIKILSSIFGDSILNNAVFFGMFKRMFFIIFAVNLLYFAISRYSRSKNKEISMQKETSDE